MCQLSIVMTNTGISSRKRTRVEKIAIADGAQLGRFDCDHVKRLAINGEEFHFVSRATVINMDDCAHITKLQSMRRQVGRKNYLFVFSYHHFTSFADTPSLYRQRRMIHNKKMSRYFQAYCIKVRIGDNISTGWPMLESLTRR